MIINDVDFAAMYRRHVKLSGRRSRSADDWDERAKSLAHKVMDTASDYTRQFVSNMDLAGANSLLDIGCGPGTIALAVADKLERVIGLDYSPAMLEQMRKHASHLGLENVETCLRSWDDDWSDIPQCDIVVASRSSMVPDMARALDKMTRQARLRCYMTHRAANPNGDAGASRTVGNGTRTTGQGYAFPDYIYIVNILYGMGLNPRLDYIELPAAEQTQQGADPVRWAFIAWDVRDV